MTTLVTITNSSTNGATGHSIVAKTQSQSTILKPGESIEFHIWKGNDISVEEFPETAEVETKEIFGVEVKT